MTITWKQLRDLGQDAADDSPVMVQITVALDELEPAEGYEHYEHYIMDIDADDVVVTPHDRPRILLIMTTVPPTNAPRPKEGGTSCDK